MLVFTREELEVLLGALEVLSEEYPDKFDAANLSELAAKIEKEVKGSNDVR